MRDTQLVMLAFALGGIVFLAAQWLTLLRERRAEQRLERELEAWRRRARERGW